MLTLQINPEFAFKEVMDMSRLKNLHGKFVKVREDEKLHSNSRTTRSGNAYYLQTLSDQLSQLPKVTKSILKIKSSEAENFYSCAPAQKLAIIRGLLMS